MKLKTFDNVNTSTVTVYCVTEMKDGVEIGHDYFTLDYLEPNTETLCRAVRKREALKKAGAEVKYVDVINGKCNLTVIVNR